MRRKLFLHGLKENSRDVVARLRFLEGKENEKSIEMMTELGAGIWVDAQVYVIHFMSSASYKALTLL